MDKSRISLFVAGLLVLSSAGASFLFYTKYRSVESDRAEDARRIRELESDLKLTQAEISEYREKLREAEKIAEHLERERDAKERLALERASKIEELETRIAATDEPEPPEEPVVAVLIEDEAPLVEEVQTNRDREETATTPEGETTEAETAAIETETPRSDEAEPTPTEAETPRTEAETAHSDLERELEEVRVEKRELEMKHAALLGEKAGGVPLGKVKVVTGLKLKGKVLVVNQRHNFLVVDLGARDGVEKGMVLILHRGRRFIGKCQVEKVYNRMAAADLVLDWMKDEVQVSDGVRKF